MDEVQLEHRLGLIEATIDRATRDLNLNHSVLLLAVGKVEGKIETQNGRIGKLEVWRTQVTAIYGMILFTAPFIFFALNKWFGG